MLSSKRLPFNKTVVTEMKVQLADMLTRTVRLKGSVATPIGIDDGFNNGDVNIADANPYEMRDIKSIVILSSLDPFDIELYQGTYCVKLSSTGLFAHTGPAERIVVKPKSGTDKIRLQYIWS